MFVDGDQIIILALMYVFMDGIIEPTNRNMKKANKEHNFDKLD